MFTLTNCGMKRKADAFNVALGVFLEWGPAQERDIRDRISKAVEFLGALGITEEQLRDLLDQRIKGSGRL